MQIMTKSLIIGVCGQIGSYLADKLLSLGHQVYGISRHVDVTIDPLITLYIMDINDHFKLTTIVTEIRPDEIYHLSSPTNINETIADPIMTYQTNIISLTHLCETIKSLSPYAPKLFTTNSSETFRGNITEEQLVYTFDEQHLNFSPISPYGVSKVSAYWLIRYYRESYHLPFWTGFLCNVISPRLRDAYLIPKIIKHVKEQSDYILHIGNIDLEKDFSHASDIVDGILTVMHNDPEDISDYVISSGQSYSLRSLIEYIYQEKNIHIRWDKSNGYDAITGRELIVSDPLLCRKYEKSGEKIIGNNSKLLSVGWMPKHTIQSLIHEMYTK
jgi:GDPmannose 4,6-dehydratase